MGDIDVLIVGAGPSGMATALAASEQGLSVQIIEKHAQRLPYSRAILVNSSTLALLEPFGVAKQIIAHGVPVRSFAIRRFSGEILSTPILLPATSQPLINLPQIQTELCFEAALQARGVDIQRPCELIGLTQETDFVAVTLRDADGANRELRARFVVGADGFRSSVRELAGIAYPCVDFPRTIVAMDVEMDWPYQQDAVVWLEDRGGILALRLPDGLIRLAGVDLERLRQVKGFPAPRKVVWKSEFEVHFAYAETYGSGRVWLAGDAAHVHSPVGGRGMNMGIADGIALGKALASNALSAYGAERRAVAKSWVETNHMLTNIALGTDIGARRKRKLARMALNIAKVIMPNVIGNFIFKRLAGI